MMVFKINSMNWKGGMIIWRVEVKCKRKVSRGINQCILLNQLEILLLSGIADIFDHLFYLFVIFSQIISL